MTNMKEKLTNVIRAFNRYPVVVVFLLVAATVNILMIESDQETFMTALLALVIGAMLSMVAQQIYERLFTTIKERLLLQVGAILLTIGYYFVIRTLDSFSMELEIKTAVVMFALMMVFIWLPSIKSNVLFNQTFMATFKAFFTTVLFTAVIAIGLNVSIFAIDQLLISINYKVYLHVLNFIFTLFSPLFFLSLIPLYPGRAGRMTDEQKERMHHAVASPKILVVLLSYVIVPLAWLYTFILVIYVLLNISGDFWTNNLLEPMLVSYSITIILITILVSGLTNSFASLFRKVLPKVLLPIVLFQLVASVLKVGEMGITHGRYYVLLFGLFALLTSIIFSFLPIQKSGWIAAILIVFSIISIVPPIDAFTVSRVNQTNLLQQTLIDNDMWKDGEIIPNSDISVTDKRRITQTVNYLNRMGYTNRITWLPDLIRFNQTFGFNEVYGEGDEEQDWGKSVYLNIEGDPIIDITGYDRLIHMYISHDVNFNEETITVPIEMNDLTYRLEELYEDETMYLKVKVENQEIFRFNLTEAFQQVIENGNDLTVDQATVTAENDFVRMSVIPKFIDQYKGHYSADIYILLEIK